MSIIVFIILLSFLVIIHELGHYLAAKKFKVTVEEFGLGYPPRAKALFTKWGTLFSLNWIPVGGFVKLLGEDGPEESAGTSTKGVPFYTRPIWQRLVIILAGATVNFVFGVLAFSIVFSIMGIPKVIDTPVIKDIAPGSPAVVAELSPGDTVQAVTYQGETITVTSTQQVIDAVKRYQGQEITLTILPSCTDDCASVVPETHAVTPRTAADTPAGEGSLGIVFDVKIENQFYPWPEQIARGAWFGLQEAFYLGVATIETLRTVLVNLITKGQMSGQLMGPVGIVHEAHRTNLFGQGWLVLLRVTGLLSVSLAVMNILPIPALDGGRAVFIALEGLLGKKRISTIENKAHYVGYIILLALIIGVTANDIWKIIGS